MSKLKSAFYLASASVGAMAAYNALVAWQTPAPAHRLGGYFDRYPARDGDLAYAVAGRATTAPPLLLLHGLRAGDSMNEWREALDSLGAHREVFALDLPGFGQSPGRWPKPETLAEVVADFLRDVVKQPAVIVAVGGASAVAVHAAQNAPGAVVGIALVCPPAPESEAHAPDQTPLASGSYTERAAFRGITSGNVTGQSGSARPSLWRRLLEGDLDALRRFYGARLFRVPVLGSTLLLALLRRSRLKRWANAHGFYDKTRADDVWLHQSANAARESALHGSAGAIMSGVLTMPWAEAWHDLPIPALLLWGRHAVADADSGGLEVAPELLALKADARLVVLDHAMLLPHVEQPRAFAAALEQWLNNV